MCINMLVLRLLIFYMGETNMLRLGAPTCFATVPCRPVQRSKRVIVPNLLAYTCKVLLQGPGRSVWGLFMKFTAYWQPSYHHSALISNGIKAHLCNRRAVCLHG